MHVVILNVILSWFEPHMARGLFSGTKDLRIPHFTYSEKATLKTRNIS